MGCRIGMATDVADRVRRLKDTNEVPAEATYRTLRSGMTYEEANTYENTARTNCGPHCQGHAGGGYVAGRVWSVYRIDW